MSTCKLLTFANFYTFPILQLTITVFVGYDDRHHKLHDLPGYDQRGGQGWQWRGLLPLLPRGDQDEDKVVVFREREKILDYDLVNPPPFDTFGKT